MTSQLFDMSEPVVPTEAESELAVEASRRLAPHLFAKDSLRIQVSKDGGPGEPVELPAAAVRLLVRMLTDMAQGNALKLIPIKPELLTEQAADLLSVSHAYFLKLLDEGKIPFCTVGRYRRVRFNDLMAYKKQNDAARAAIADQLVAEAQELGLY